MQGIFGEWKKGFAWSEREKPRHVYTMTMSSHLSSPTLSRIEAHSAVSVGPCWVSSLANNYLFTLEGILEARAGLGA